MPTAHPGENGEAKIGLGLTESTPAIPITAREGVYLVPFYRVKLRLMEDERLTQRDRLARGRAGELGFKPAQ